MRYPSYCAAILAVALLTPFVSAADEKKEEFSRRNPVTEAVAKTKAGIVAIRVPRPGEKDMIGTDIAVVKWGGTAGSSHATVTGNALNNVFYPGPGTNVINGLAGDDTVMEGDDTANTAMDTFHGGAGTDTMDYSLRTADLTVTMDNTFHGGDGKWGASPKFLVANGIEVVNLHDQRCIDMMTDFIKKNPTLWNEDIGK